MSGASAQKERGDTDLYRGVSVIAYPGPPVPASPNLSPQQQVRVSCPSNAPLLIQRADVTTSPVVPLLTATEKRALQRAGVTHVQQLATLMDYGSRAMNPAPGREQEITRLSTHWPLGGRLPVLVQRARAAVHRDDPGIEAKPFLLSSGFGSLPDPQRYPDLVKVFLDAQHDYIEDRVYLLAALVAGPDTTVEVVEVTTAPPDTAAEQALLVTWLTPAPAGHCQRGRHHPCATAYLPVRSAGSRGAAHRPDPALRCPVRHSRVLRSAHVVTRADAGYAVLSRRRAVWTASQPHAHLSEPLPGGQCPGLCLARGRAGLLAPVPCQGVRLSAAVRP